MTDQAEFHGVEPIAVSIDGIETVWSLDQRADQESRWTLILTAPDGRSWTATAQGLWNAFTDLRQQTDPLGYKLCCAAARVEAVMRKGRDRNNDEVYLLTRRTLLGLPHKASMLDHAPATKIATVDEQQARYDRWLATPWWRALLPGDPVG
ncbi:hypothetical protein ABZS29_15105 [Kribbella sp. NPDC005582]|uniref:hypothetical protein n=1 Tax=Kribbella sp. NPDC005582 TaxID=3156893 RepID=UPI0033A7DCC8